MIEMLMDLLYLKPFYTYIFMIGLYMYMFVDSGMKCSVFDGFLQGGGHVVSLILLLLAFNIARKSIITSQ